MKINEVPPDTIVVGIDGSPDSIRALDWAAATAQQQGQALTLVHSCDPAAFERGGIWSSWGVDWQELRRQSEEPYGEALASAHEHLRELHPDLEVNLVADFVDPRLALDQLSNHAHQIVLGSRGRGPVATLLLGSVSATVARKADCPVVVVKAGTTGDAAHEVVVSVDPSTESSEAIEFAFRYASMMRHPLRVVRCREQSRAPVHTQPEEHWQQNEEIADMRAKFPDVAINEEIRFDRTEQVLVEHSRTAALVVLGRPSSPHALDRVLHGGATTAVLEHAQCPVAIVPERSS